MGLRHNVVIFILVIGTTWAANPKSFSIFNVVQFKNEACVSTSTTMGNGNRNGTCFTSEGAIFQSFSKENFRPNFLIFQNVRRRTVKPKEIALPDSECAAYFWKRNAAQKLTKIVLISSM